MPSLLVLLITLSLFQVCFAYIPASPTNSSKDAIAGGLNVTDISKLRMEWYNNGSYMENVSYQLVGNGSQGISRGALVHFSEVKANNLTPPTSTPWIALVSCDFNATDASQEEDIFTLARDKGAVAALLYSLTSLACVINPEYADPATFDQVFDIFSTQSLTSAHLIEYQFGQLGSANTSLSGYDSQRLNDTGLAINNSIALGYPVASGFLYAILQAYNATGDTSEPNGPTGGSTATKTNTPGTPNTALAMIILYAITGCVSALFCIVIISGAIRAIRHPERYGPRSRGIDGGGLAQSRAGGLGRAILDTFPLFKFGTQSRDVSTPSAAISNPKDLEDQSSGQSAMEMNHWEADTHKTSHEDDAQDSPSASGVTTQDREPVKRASREVPSSTQTNITSKHTNDMPESGESKNIAEASTSRVGPQDASVDVRDDVVPASIGRETCPICIVDFEEGDDIRLLPCEGKHCFHQQCVDPWLLELSSSCPICRQDFLALETMISGRSGGAEDIRHSNYGGPHSPSTQGNRFSRYLRFAARRRAPRRIEELDPTDPYMPTAPETSLYPRADI